MFVSHAVFEIKHLNIWRYQSKNASHYQSQKKFPNVF